MNRYERLEGLVRQFVRIFTLAVFCLLLLFAGYLVRHALPFLTSGHLASIFTSSWRPLAAEPSFGLLPMIFGTLYIGFGASMLALPLALGSACVIHNAMKGRFKAFFLALTDMLAGIPSVVYGLLGFFTIVKFLEVTRFMTSGESVFAAIVTLAVMNTPFMISGFTKAFQAVEDQYGFQTEALGVTRWYSMTHLTLSAARGNILTGYMIALSRSLGETMAVMMVVGNSPIFPSMFGKGITLSGVIALEMGAAQLDSLHHRSLYTAGIILLLLLLAVNHGIRKIESWLGHD